MNQILKTLPKKEIKMHPEKSQRKTGKFNQTLDNKQNTPEVLSV